MHKHPELHTTAVVQINPDGNYTERLEAISHHKNIIDAYKACETLQAKNPEYVFAVVCLPRATRRATLRAMNMRKGV